MPAARQPVSNESGLVWAVLDGEIYNSLTLQTRLRARGHSFTSQTDAETLVHLYEDYREDLVHALDGMFAFALWDEQLGRLLLARDRFGEKPLFVRRDHPGLCFASELSALLSVYARTPDLDLDAIDMYMVLGYVPGPRTIVQGVEQLPPGQLLTWDQPTDMSSDRSYWSATRSAPARRETPQELTAETVHLLERSVHATLASGVPIGVFLGDGVASALVTALVAASSAGAAHTFTVGFDGAEPALLQARWLAERLGTVHHELMIDQADVARRAPSLLAELDQPLADPTVIPLHALSELARRHVPVVLGGAGADELFGGSGRYGWMTGSRVKDALCKRLAVVAARTPALSVARGAMRSGNVSASEPGWDWYLDRATANRRQVRPKMYGPALSGHAVSDAALQSLVPHLEGVTGEFGPDAVMQVDQRHWLPDDVLCKVDRVGMLNSLEVRSPYLGREVAEFANSVRADIHLSGRGNNLLRRSLDAYLPDCNTREQMHAFRAPDGRWLRGALRPALEDQIAQGTVVRQGFIDGDFLRSALNAHLSGEDRAPILWPVLALGLWLDRYAGRP